MSIGSILSMLNTIIIFFTGFVVLILGGDYFVKGSSSLAFRLKLSPLVVGLTIVAFGTSAPELLISIQAAFKGSPDITMGNVIGSNICNISLILGLTAVITPVLVNKNSIRIDWPMTMGASILLYFTVQKGYITSLEGAGFFVLLIVYIVFIIRKSRKDHVPFSIQHPNENIPEAPPKQLTKDIVMIILGAVGLYYGSKLLVGSVKDLAVAMGVEERVVGLTMVALGTSLPELVTAAVASYKGHTDLAIGNLMGSNIFNILSILGITSIIKPITVNASIIHIDIIWMLSLTLLILPLMVIGKTINRFTGIILMVVYFVYIYYVVAS